MAITDHFMRIKISSKSQHPLKHDITDFAYTNEALPGVTNLNTTIDWLVATLYPKTQPSVATVGALPAVGNTLLDYRVVLDDGDGKAASYRWEQREGEVAPAWHKIYDMDWGETSILSNFLAKTQDVYVYKYGHDDVDTSGTVIVGDLSGQSIYGGASAGTNLTLLANSGDGTGPNTGFVQFGDNIRPTADATFGLGTASRRFTTLYAVTGVHGTLTATSGSITDTSGSISFGDENLSTTGDITGGTTTLSGAMITNSTGAISFGNENLSTTGNVNGAILTGSSSLVAATMTMSTGSIVDSTGAISFADENLTTTGTLGAGDTTVTRLDADNLRLDGNTLSVQNVDGTLTISANGLGVVDITSAMTTLGQTITGDVGVTGTETITGQLNVDNLRIDGNALTSTNSNGDVAISPDGSGRVSTSAAFIPTTNGLLDLGLSGSRFRTLYLGTSIHDGTTSFSVANLMTFATVGAPAPGDSLFWDGTKWAASAPDTEIDHGAISGLSDDDHTQYLLLAGRSGGQSVIGGVDPSDNLDLESTSDATKGFIQTKDTIRAFTDASYSGGWSGNDVGGSSNRYRHIYTAGEFFGLRFENRVADVGSSVQNVGRTWYRTDTGRLNLDTGSSIVSLNILKAETDTVWTGAEAVKNTDVSSTAISDARLAQWTFHDNSGDFEQIYAKIEATSATNVRVTTNVNLPAGTYRLIGVQ